MRTAPGGPVRKTLDEEANSLRRAAYASVGREAPASVIPARQPSGAGMWGIGTWGIAPIGQRGYW